MKKIRINSVPIGDQIFGKVNLPTAAIVFAQDPAGLLHLFTGGQTDGIKTVVYLRERKLLLEDDGPNHKPLLLALDRLLPADIPALYVQPIQALDLGLAGDEAHDLFMLIAFQVDYQTFTEGNELITAGEDGPVINLASNISRTPVPKILENLLVKTAWERLTFAHNHHLIPSLNGAGN